MRVSRLLGVVLTTPWLVGLASAHEIAGSRFDAPLPLPLLFGGAGVVVAATAGWVARADVDPGDRSLVERTFPAAPRWRHVLRATGLAGFVAILWYGVAGTQAAADNPATLFAWAGALKGVAITAVLVGSPWTALSPWRTVYEGFVLLESRDLGPLTYPSWLGVWPATGGFVIVVGLTENISEIPQSPRLTAGLLAVYAATMLLGGVVFGREFFERADALEVLYTLLGRVSPLGWRETGVAVRSPAAACARVYDHSGGDVFVVAAVYTVSFDGFASTPEYQTLALAARDVVGGPAALLLYVLGLLGFVVAYRAVTGLVDLIGDAETGATEQPSAGRVRAAAGAFAPTVVPIAAAYEVAHNYPFVARNCSQLLSVLAGVETELLGWLSVPAFWYSQVVLVVAGHVLAVAAAHRVAVRRYGDRALRAHLPLVVLMVGYTMLSLWIVSRPIVG
jgi:hypothetical protein